MMTGYYAQQVRRDTLPGIKRGNRPEWAKLFTEYLKEEAIVVTTQVSGTSMECLCQNGFRSILLRQQPRFLPTKKLLSGR